MSIKRNGIEYAKTDEVEHISFEAPSELTFSQWEHTVNKYERIVCMNFNCNGAIPSGTFYTIGTLPDEYCPYTQIRHLMVAQNGTPVLFTINTNGLMQIYATSDLSNGSFPLRQTITYITK